MSHAYELFYANHLLESKTEPCAGCFQAAETSEDTEVVPTSEGVLIFGGFEVDVISCKVSFLCFLCVSFVSHASLCFLLFTVLFFCLSLPLTPVRCCQIAQVSPLYSSDPVLGVSLSAFTCSLVVPRVFAGLYLLLPCQTFLCPFLLVNLFF